MVGQVRLDPGQFGGVGDRPETVAETVLRGRREQRRALGRTFDHRARGVRRRGGGVVAPVGQEQGFQVRVGGAHQGRPFRDHVRHDVLVRQDDALRRLRQAQGPDDPALEVAGRVALFVDVQGGLGVGGQDALGEPVVQGVGRLFVADATGWPPGGGSAGRCCAGRPIRGGTDRPGARSRRTAERSRRPGCRPGRGRSAGPGKGSVEGPCEPVRPRDLQCSLVHRRAVGGMRDDRGKAGRTRSDAQ